MVAIARLEVGLPLGKDSLELYDWGVVGESQGDRSKSVMRPEPRGRVLLWGRIEDRFGKQPGWRWSLMQARRLGLRE